MLKFSVLISVYIRENPEYLNAALESLLKQTLKPNEVVLVKDGLLTDTLNKIIERFETQFDSFVVIQNETNLGLSESLNKGLIACANEYVARMDTDDICREDRFEKQIDFLTTHREIDIVGTWANKIDNEGNIIGNITVPTEHVEIDDLIWTCPFIHPSVMFKKESILNAGSYNTSAGPRQDDYDLWFRCAFNKLKFANIPEYLLYYRFNDDTVKKNDYKVGMARFKVGYRGVKRLKKGPLAYIGISIPLFRSLLPYPLNVWFYKAMNKINPRNKSGRQLSEAAVR